MSKYELSIATNYVPSWTYDEAIREIFQNAVDAGDLSWSYNEQECILYISNGGAQLEAKTLLLGSTTKIGDTKSIGQFGEGYKLALLVLTRSGKQVKIYNGKSREVWTAKLVNSRRYGAQVLTIYTEKLAFWEKPEDKVMFEIEGITEEEFEVIKSHNLHVNPPQGDVYETTRGEILKDSIYQKKIFVNGLYVCEDTTLTYGYNILPQYLKLDRDRSMVRTFDIHWETSAMWLELADNSDCTQLCLDGANDVQYIDAQYQSSKVKGLVINAFKAKYGTDCIPCSSQADLNEVHLSYPSCTPIVVSEITRNLIRADIMHDLIPCTTLSLKERLELWYASYAYNIPPEGEAQWKELLEELN